METKKITFFNRIKKAIVNFDEYQNFSMERISVAIKYFIKLMAVFSVIVGVGFTYSIYRDVSTISKEFEENFPEFGFSDNRLVTNNEEKYILQDENYYFAIVLDNTSTDIEEWDYERGVILLNDKVILKHSNISQVITYDNLSKTYDVNNITKEGLVNYLNSSKMIGIYSLFFIIECVCTFVLYSILILFDVVILAVLGFLISRIFRMNFKFKSLFSMSFYAITLSILLYMIYIVINTITGFEVKYFKTAYDTISYIYMITAILIIKSDLMKQQMELTKIAEVQRQVKQELQDKKEKEEKDKQEQKKKENEDEEKKSDKKEKGPEGEPEGSKA